MCSTLQQIQLGVRVREGPGKGELVWRRPNRMTLQNMLKHPLYAGAYVYGRRQGDPRRKQPERPSSGRVVMTSEDWLALLPNHCPAYISAERYENRSVAITTNLVFSEWERIFKHPMTTMAALDRVVHHSVILDMMGLESYRARAAQHQQHTEEGGKASEQLAAAAIIASTRRSS